MRKIILASNNSGKLKEFQRLFADINIDIIPQNEFAIPDAEETGSSFAENALLKARHAANIVKLPAIADDSGLIIDVLNGEPGIYSARYAGEHGNTEKNNQKVLNKLNGVPTEQRKARFHCCLAFVRNENDQQPIVCEADWEGWILNKAQGENGFGYDPIFYVPTYRCSAAELDTEIKNKISHRALALNLLIQKLSDRTLL